MVDVSLSRRWTYRGIAQAHDRVPGGWDGTGAAPRTSGLFEASDERIQPTE